MRKQSRIWPRHYGGARNTDPMEGKYRFSSYPTVCHFYSTEFPRSVNGVSSLHGWPVQTEPVMAKECGEDSSVFTPFPAEAYQPSLLFPHFPLLNLPLLSYFFKYRQISTFPIPSLASEFSCCLSGLGGSWALGSSPHEGEAKASFLLSAVHHSWRSRLNLAGSGT